MKFSDRISNQSTAGFCARMCAKWTVRSPTPMPRSGRFQRLLMPSRDCSGRSGDGKGPPSRAAPPGNGGESASGPCSRSCPSRRSCPSCPCGRRSPAPRSRPCPCRSSCPRSRRRRTCSRPCPCTRSCPCTRACRRRRAAALALARVLAGAAVLVGLAAALALTGVVALTDVLVGRWRAAFFSSTAKAFEPATMPATTAPITFVNSLRSMCSLLCLRPIGSRRRSAACGGGRDARIQEDCFYALPGTGCQGRPAFRDLGIRPLAAITQHRLERISSPPDRVNAPGPAPFPKRPPGCYNARPSRMNADLERLVRLQHARIRAQAGGVQPARTSPGGGRSRRPLSKRRTARLDDGPRGGRQRPEEPPAPGGRAPGPGGQAVQVQGPAHGREDQQGIHGHAPRDRGRGA